MMHKLISKVPIFGIATIMLWGAGSHALAFDPNAAVRRQLG
jgi:hypothetical protein